MKTTFTPDYSIITFATGKLKYLTFAFNCARSVLLFNEIKFYIISDLEFDIPVQYKENIFIISARTEHLDQGTGIKLYIDQYLQTKYTLFIDADCLCYGSLKMPFDLFAGKNVSVVGNIVDAASWCGETEAKAIYQNFGITQLPRFNGGVYYISKSEQAVKIFDKAREIAFNYDGLGFQRIHKKWINEEILIAIAIAVFNETPVADNGILMTDLYTDPHTSKLNILTGYRQLNNPKPGKNHHRPWYMAGKINPLILHFGSGSLYKYPYLSQHVLLKFNAKNVSSSLATIMTMLFIHVPYKSKYWIYSILER